MSARLTKLVRRREGLIAQSAAQREQLVRSYRRVLRPVRFVESGVGLIKIFQAHPVITASLAAFLMKPGGRLIKIFRAHPVLMASLTALLLAIRRGKAGSFSGWSLLEPLGSWWGKRPE